MKTEAAKPPSPESWIIAEVRKRNPEWSAILEQAVKSETAELRALVGELADQLPPCSLKCMRGWCVCGRAELQVRAEEARKP